MDKIAIIGMGLIGGSIGLAIKQAKIADLQVFGYDAVPLVGKTAVQRGAADKVPWRLNEVLEGADMVILATPVLAIRETLETIADMLEPGCIVTDTGSTKEAILAWAEEYLPQGVSFIGGHPMSGKELSGIDNADPNLFRGSRYVVIPGKDATKEAVSEVISLVELVGARPYFLGAYEHDSYVAAVSHLPILLSAALVSATTKSPSWREMSKLAATGFRDVSRLASGNPVMNLDISVTNRQPIVHWINEAIKELQGYRDMVEATAEEEGAETLGSAFVIAWEAREKWLSMYESGLDDYDQEGTPIPSAGEQMADIIFGSQLRERYGQIISMQERKTEERRPRRLRKS